MAIGEEEGLSGVSLGEIESECSVLGFSAAAVIVALRELIEASFGSTVNTSSFLGACTTL